MGRLTRAEQQARTRSRVLAAARAEFTERGFRDAKVDRIAERVELTRGAVYSNFPSKRALYFAVLADAAERRTEAPASGPAEPGRTGRAALGALARAWVDRLPLTTSDVPPCLGAGLTSEALSDASSRLAFAQLMRLDAVLLGLSLETLGGRGGEDAPRTTGGRGARAVRVAEAVLTTLHGASQMATAAPGFVDPFTVVRACERLAGLDLDDAWPLPHVAHVPPAEPADENWSPPGQVLDAVRREPVSLTEDGVVAVLGLHRLEAAEDALRAAPADQPVTAVVVTGEPAERMPLARIVVADLCGPLRRAFPAQAWPRLRLVFDDAGSIAAAAGLAHVGDATEAAVRVAGGRIVARSGARGAGHAAASFEAPVPRA